MTARDKCSVDANGVSLFRWVRGAGAACLRHEWWATTDGRRARTSGENRRYALPTTSARAKDGSVLLILSYSAVSDTRARASVLTRGEARVDMRYSDRFAIGLSGGGAWELRHNLNLVRNHVRRKYPSAVGFELLLPDLRSRNR